MFNKINALQKDSKESETEKQLVCDSIERICIQKFEESSYEQHRLDNFPDLVYSSSSLSREYKLISHNLCRKLNDLDPNRPIPREMMKSISSLVKKKINQSQLHDEMVDRIIEEEIYEYQSEKIDIDRLSTKLIIDLNSELTESYVKQRVKDLRIESGIMESDYKKKQKQ